MSRGDTRAGSFSIEMGLGVTKRGQALLNDPLLNKGTCFTAEERRALGLEGLLPPAISTFEEQQLRAYENYQRSKDDVAKYLFLSALQDRNETLFYRLVIDHIEEMAPIIYTPTVGRVCEEYSHIFRRPRGIYISTRDKGRMIDVLRAARREEARIIVLTDNEGILGLGDLGVGGMGIPIGKLALYTAGAGIHPAACLPIDFDVGTDNEALLADPLYLGVRHKRLRGAPYFELLDELVEAIAAVLPGVVVQWEDFSNDNAFAILERYRTRIACFNDDIQGTGAIVAAGIETALHRLGRSIRDERVVFYGAGASGGGCAMSVRGLMAAAGLNDAAIRDRVVLLDSRGLIVADRPGLSGHKAALAAPTSLVQSFRPAGSGPLGLMDVVRGFKPTIVVGCSGQPGAFTEDIVRAIHAGCPRPIILALSNPTKKIEATPENIIRWTDGAATIGTGSPFPPVDYQGAKIAVGQGNNALIFPGVGLGAIAVGARWLPDSVFLAASQAVAEYSSTLTKREDPIFPPIESLRAVSGDVARAVGRAIVEARASRDFTEAEIDARVDAVMWEPVYRPYRAQ